MLKRMDLVGGNETLYDGGIGEGTADFNMAAIGDEEEYPLFFEWDDQSENTFPSLRFDSDHVPVGDSANFCAGLSWTTVKKRNQYDKYLDLRGMTPCRDYAKADTQWESDYPTHDINFKLWKQSVTKGDSSCSGGIADSNADNCYRYMVARAVCALVKFSHDADRNTYSWVYTGGCFKDNEPVWYEALAPYYEEKFVGVKFQVRIDHRGFDEISDAFD